MCGIFLFVSRLLVWVATSRAVELVECPGPASYFGAVGLSAHQQIWCLAAMPDSGLRGPAQEVDASVRDALLLCFWQEREIGERSLAVPFLHRGLRGSLGHIVIRDEFPVRAQCLGQCHCGSYLVCYSSFAHRPFPEPPLWNLHTTMRRMNGPADPIGGRSADWLSRPWRGPPDVWPSGFANPLGGFRRPDGRLCRHHGLLR